MSAPAAGRLVVDHPAEGVARLTIEHPARRNALSHDILDAIVDALAGLDARCVILTGSDGVFSAGYDIGDVPEEEFARHTESLVAHPFTAAIDAVEDYPYPTLAALNGHAIGGGLELALACDLRIAADRAKLGMPPAKLGLVYSHTGLRRFIDAIGAPRTRELFLVGRNVDAATALGWGLVNSIHPREKLEQAAMSLAREIAANAPLALTGNKRIIRTLLDAEGALDGETESELVELRRSCFTSADFREGVRAFAEKRPPRWRGE